MKNAPHTSDSPRLRLFHNLLRLLTLLLIVVTALAVPLLVLAAFGKASFSVDAHLESPFVVEFDDLRRIGVGGDASLTYENFEIGREHRAVDGAPKVVVPVGVAHDDRDSRIVLAVAAVAWLGAAWVGLLSMRRLVDSARAGEPFVDRNVVRLRWLGAALLAVVAVDVSARMLLNQTLDSDIAIHVPLSGGGMWMMAVTGVAVLALAEVFAEAVILSDFDKAAI